VLSLSATALVATVFAASPVDVRSATNCPSAEAIVERLLPLLPVAVAGPSEGQHVAQVEVGELEAAGAMILHLRLLRHDGSVTGDRRLRMQGTCEDMSEAVATVIATWETQPLPGAVPDATPAPAVKEAFTPLQVQPAPTVSPLQIIVGAGGGVALVGGLAARGSAEIQFGKVTSHWQLRFCATGETIRQLDLGQGHVDWRHTFVAAGVGWRALDPFWLLALDAGPVAGWATLTGSGYAADRRQHPFEYGVAAGVRVGRKFGPLALWSEWRSEVWAKGQRATLSPTSANAALPRLDTAVSLGMSVVLH